MAAAGAVEVVAVLGAVEVAAAPVVVVAAAAIVVVVAVVAAVVVVVVVAVRPRSPKCRPARCRFPWWGHRSHHLGRGSQPRE